MDSLLGTYGTEIAGVSQIQACTTCDAGYTCLGNGTWVSRNLCSVGGYCPLGSYQPTPCPTGTISLLTGAANISTCQPCSAGFYCPYFATTIEIVCPINHYCPQGTSDPINCWQGTYSDNTGLQLASECQNCTVGSYCVAGTSPQPCPLGKYNPNLGGSSLNSCLDCTPGFACPSDGLSAVTLVCLAGYW